MLLVKADDLKAVTTAADALRKGESIIYPTDTVYGLGCDATSPVAVRALIEVKGRSDKPLSVLVADLGMASKYCIVSACLRKFSSLLPGPYTIVLERKGSGIAHNAAGDSIGIRMPACEFSLALVREFDKPVISTSANFSGEPPPSAFAEISGELKARVGLVVDGGECREKEASTVIDMRGEKPVVLRSGAGYARFQEMQKSVL